MCKSLLISPRFAVRTPAPPGSSQNAKTTVKLISKLLNILPQHQLKAWLKTPLRDRRTNTANKLLRFLGKNSFSKKCREGARSSARRMTENGSESLPFEPPEQESIRLREENARLRRLLAVHGIPIPQLAPENPPPTKTVETGVPDGQAGACQKKNRDVSKPVSRERRCLRTAMGEGRQRVGICAGSREGLEGYQQKPSRGAEESRPQDTKVPPHD